MITKHLKYFFAFFYLNIFSGELSEEKKVIIHQLEDFFKNKKSDQINRQKRIKQCLTIASFKKTETEEEKIKKKKESLHQFYNNYFILSDFTGNSSLFSMNFKKWVKSYNSFDNEKKIEKCFKITKKENILAEILHPDKGEHINEGKYINALKNVLEDLTDLIVENKQPDNEEMGKLFKAFYGENSNEFFYVKRLILQNLLIFAALICNFYKNNNNKKVAVALILLDILAIASFFNEIYKLND